jgi:hypothetical protein
MDVPFRRWVEPDALAALRAAEGPPEDSAPPNDGDVADAIRALEQALRSRPPGVGLAALLSVVAMDLARHASRPEADAILEGLRRTSESLARQAPGRADPAGTARALAWLDRLGQWGRAID